MEGQSELPRPNPLNSVESDLGCTSRIYFENAGDTCNLTLKLHNVRLTSQNHGWYMYIFVTSVIATKQTLIKLMKFMFFQ